VSDLGGGASAAPLASEVLTTVVAPFARAVSPQGALYWLYLATSGALALGVYVYANRGAKALGVRQAIDFVFPKAIYSHKSAQLDFRYLLLNTLLYGVLFSPIVLASGFVAKSTIGALVGLFGVPDQPLLTGWTASIAATALLVVVADLGFYVSHYLQHKVPLLWEFHKVHHSAEVLHPVAGFRAHPVDQTLDAVLIGSATGLVIGLAAYAVGGQVGPVTILGANVFAFLSGIAGVHLRHSHIWLSYGRRLNHILVSPAMHQIHHSVEPRHLNKNLGGMFTVWDWMMGTLYIPVGREQFSLGLTGGEHREYDSLLRLYVLPLKKATRLSLRRPSSKMAPIA
jgi:sterol desaturase/sphingolipid hydroxylase (fatty acid hydroxylase superfamily)